MSGRSYIKELAKKSRKGTLSSEEKKLLEDMRRIVNEFPQVANNK